MYEGGRKGLYKERYEAERVRQTETVRCGEVRERSIRRVKETR